MRLGKSLQKQWEDAHISLWINYRGDESLPQLPGKLHDRLRSRLQAIYRQATGEPTAVLSIDIPKAPHDPL